MMQRRQYQKIVNLLALSLALAGLSSCVKDKSEVPDSTSDRMVSLPLSLALPQEAPLTKMTDDVTQASGTFRGARTLVVPFQPSRSVEASDAVWSPVLDMSSISEAKPHLYKWSYFREGCSSVLAYAVATPENVTTTQDDPIAFKKRNGSLLEPDYTNVSIANDLRFRPEPFLNSWEKYPAFSTWREKLISYLNLILQAKVTNKLVTPNKSYMFNYPEQYSKHPKLKEALEAFTAYGAVTPASEESLNKRLTDLYRAVYPLSADPHNSLDYHDGTYYYVYELACEIIRRITNNNNHTSWQFVSITGTGTNATVKLLVNGPGHFGLPAGSFSILYREGERKYRIGYDNEDKNERTRIGLYTADPASYVYPPSLFYCSNSRLLTTSNDKVASYYEGDASWSSILTHYTDDSVYSYSRAAAIETPLQYGVASLRVQLQQTSATLKDDAGAYVNVDNGNFPLTGILVSGQHPVNFAFKPISGTDDFIVYDSDVYDGTTPRAYISSTQSSEPIYTLLLESLEGEDVQIALEFINNSSSITFKGENGASVYPGMHFYLVGALRLSQGTASSSFNTVLTQDHTTKVTVTVPSLIHAHTVLPDLRTVQLSIGVDVEMDWQPEDPVSIGIQ